jgi:hypothetical protein
MSRALDLRHVAVADIGLSAAAVAEIARAGVCSSLLPPLDKTDLLEQIDAVVAPTDLDA